MRAHHKHKYELKENVTAHTDDDNGHHYILPFTTDTTHRTFDSLNRALWSLKPIAKYNDTEHMADAFVYAYRRFGRLFAQAYEYDHTEVDDWELPTVKDIHKHFRWSDNIEPKTFTLRKTEDNIHIIYEDGFLATEETLTVHKNEVDDLKAAGIRACGQGIQHEHAPYNPSITQKWRYNPSQVTFSIEVTNGTVKLGIANHPPDEPLWYKAYKHISHMTRPYAHTTFDMNKQTSVVQFTYNRNHDAEKQI